MSNLPFPNEKKRDRRAWPLRGDDLQSRNLVPRKWEWCLSRFGAPPEAWIGRGNCSGPEGQRQQ
jgi:hypothetical protein